MTVWQCAAEALQASDPSTKCARVRQLGQALERNPLPARPADELPPVGRPERPRLVHPGRLPRRGLGSEEGRVALLHAVAHIEFNAINLALDAALRFPGMPEAYYRDWFSVAEDEARHFVLLRTRLNALGGEYGDLEAHNGLWDMAERTAHDVLVRMALVPRVLEARGLDVTPGMIERLRHAGDADSVRCLEIILEEEVRHVAIGSKWFRFLCRQRGKRPDETFGELLADFFSEGLRGPFNEAARLEAGFSADEIEELRRAG